MAVSPDGDYLVIQEGNSKPLEILAARTGKTLWSAGRGPAVFSPDGTVLATVATLAKSNRSVIRLWESSTGKQFIDLDSGQSEEFLAVAFRGDGRQIAGAGKREVTVWEKSGKKVLSLPGGALSIAFSPDGKTLATGGNGGTRLWDLTTGKESRTLLAQLRPPSAVAFSLNGRQLATAAADRLVRLFDIASGKELERLPVHSNEVAMLRFSPEGEQLLASSDRQSSIWLTGLMGKGQVVPRQVVPVGKPAVFLAENRLAWGHGRQVEVLDPRRLNGVLTVSDKLSPPFCVAFSPDNRHLAVGCLTGQILLRDRTDARLVRTLPVRELGVVLAAAFSPNGGVIASACNAEVILLESATGRVIHTLSADSESALAVAFSPDGKQLATAGMEGKVRLWDVATAKELKRFQHPESCFVVAFSPDGQHLAVGIRGGPKHPEKVKVYALTTGQAVYTLTSSEGGTTRLAYSPDGQRLAWTPNDGTVRICNASTGEEVLSVRGQMVAYSPDGRRLATHDGANTVRLWDSTTGAELIRLRVSHGVASLTFSSDGRLLGSVSGDGLLKVWDGSPDG